LVSSATAQIIDAGAFYLRDLHTTMSFDRVPDEVLLRILRRALSSDKPITTSIKAYNLHRTYLDCSAFYSRTLNITSADEWNALFSEPPPRRKFPISPLLLGTSRRWYRLGSAFFYGVNTFIIMHRELGAFANQIGQHNCKSIRSIELTVFHKDDNPAPKISPLNKGYYKQVESVKVILAKRHKIHKVGLTVDQKTKEWIKVRIGMMNLARKIRNTMEKQQQQGAGWKVADCHEKNLVYSKGDYGLMSKIWVLERLPKPPKVHKKNIDSVLKDSVLAGKGKTGHGVVDVAEGSVVIERIDVEGGSMDTDVTAIRTDLPTPDTTPETTQEPDSRVNDGLETGKGSVGTAAMNIDTGSPIPDITPRTTPEPAAEPMVVDVPTRMLPLPYWGS
jgi:hypothetical protein